MNLIWILLILASLTYGLLTGSVSSVNQVIVNVGRETLELALPLVAATCFWSGILNIAREVGLLNMLQKLLSPLLRFLFPDLRDDPATLPPTLQSMYSDWARPQRPAALRRWSACSGTIRIRKPPAARWSRF